MKDAALLWRPDLPRPEPGKDGGSRLFGAGQRTESGGKVAGGVRRGREGGAGGWSNNRTFNNSQRAVRKGEDEGEGRARSGGLGTASVPALYMSYYTWVTAPTASVAAAFTSTCCHTR